MAAVCSLAWHIRLKQYHQHEGREDEEEEGEEEQCSLKEIPLHIKEEEEDEDEDCDPAVKMVTKQEDQDTEGREDVHSQAQTQIIKEEELEISAEMEDLSPTQSPSFVKTERDESVLSHTLLESKAEEDDLEEGKGGADGIAGSHQTLQKDHEEGGEDSAPLKSLQIRKEIDVEEDWQQKTTVQGQGLKEKTKDSNTSTYTTPQIKKEKEKAKGKDKEREERERVKEKEKKDKDRSKEKEKDKKDRGKDRDKEKERMKERDKAKAEGAREGSTPTQPLLQIRKKEEEERTRDGCKASHASLPTQRDEKWAKESDSASKTQLHVKREKEYDKDRGGVQTAPHLRPDKEEARDIWVHKHKSSHGKKEKSGLREGKDSNTSTTQAVPTKSTREDVKTGTPKPANTPVKKEVKRDKDVSSKEERKKPNSASGPEHKPPRTLITFDLFKPMDTHQTLALSFTDSRPKTHHHSDSRGTSSKPGSDSRTVVPSKGPKTKDAVQGKPAPPLQDTRPQQHSLKQPLKTHTPQTPKDFLI